MYVMVPTRFCLHVLVIASLSVVTLDASAAAPCGLASVVE